MRNELLSWFAREGLLLQDVVTSSEDPEHDEIKVSIKAPIIALSRAHDDFRECPDPALFGYPESCLDMMNLEDFHQFVYKGSSERARRAWAGASSGIKCWTAERRGMRSSSTRSFTGGRWGHCIAKN